MNFTRFFMNLFHSFFHLTRDLRVEFFLKWDAKIKLWVNRKFSSNHLYFKLRETILLQKVLMSRRHNFQNPPTTKHRFRKNCLTIKMNPECASISNYKLIDKNSEIWISNFWIQMLKFIPTLIHSLSPKWISGGYITEDHLKWDPKMFEILEFF